jgi:hypothetical protein
VLVNETERRHVLVIEIQRTLLFSRQREVLGVEDLGLVPGLVVEHFDVWAELISRNPLCRDLWT